MAGWKYSRQEANNRRVSRRKATSASQPGTLPGTVSAADDLAELARVLANLTPEERSALLALAKASSCRPSDPVSVSTTQSQPRSTRLC